MGRIPNSKRMISLASHSKRLSRRMTSSASQTRTILICSLASRFLNSRIHLPSSPFDVETHGSPVHRRLFERLGALPGRTTALCVGQFTGTGVAKSHFSTNSGRKVFRAQYVLSVKMGVYRL